MSSPVISRFNRRLQESIKPFFPIILLFQRVKTIEDLLQDNSIFIRLGMHHFQREKGILINSGQPGHLQLISDQQGKLIYNVRSFSLPNQSIQTNLLVVLVGSSRRELCFSERSD